MFESRCKSTSLAAKLLHGDSRTGDARDWLLDGKGCVGDDIAMLVVAAVRIGDRADEDHSCRANHLSKAKSADLCAERERNQKQQ